MRRRWLVLLVAAVLALAAALRLWGLGFDLPYIYHPDEPLNFRLVHAVFTSGDLNPHFFNYPSLMFYAYSLACVPYLIAGKLLGVLHTASDVLPPVTLAMGVTLAPMPTVILLGRLVSVALGVGSVLLTYLAGRLAAGRAAVGLLAAGALAVSPLGVRLSRYITPDPLALFFVLAAVVASILLFRRGGTRYYLAAGLCTGLAASSKYNAALVLVVVVAAHFLRAGPAAFRDRRLPLALLFAGLGFFAATPFALLDWRTFIQHVGIVERHYTGGHAGMEGSAPVWYARLLWATMGPVLLLAAIQIGRGARSRPVLLLAAFPLVYSVFISSLAVRNDRTALLLVPFLCVLAAWLVVDLVDRARAAPARSRRWLLAGVLFLAVLCLVWQAAATVAEGRRLTTVDSRETARLWIDAHLPPGSTIGIESYSPFVDPARFHVLGFGRIIDQPPDWYVAQGFDYLVLGEGMFGRFFAEPERYAAEIAQYNAFLDRFQPIQAFDDGGYEVRILQVHQP